MVESKKTYYLIALAIVLVMAVAGAFVIRLRLWPQEVFTPGVPYFGVYNTPLLQSSTARAVYAVLQYWRQYDDSLPNPSFDDVLNAFPLVDVSADGFRPYFYLPIDVAGYFNRIGYQAKVIRAVNPRTLLQYLGPSEKSPLLFWQMPSPDYEGDYISYRVLIGVSTSRKKLIVHDVFHGPAFELGFDEWRQSYPTFWPENMKHTFVVARPRHYKDLLQLKDFSLLPAPYPDPRNYERLRDTVMEWLAAIEEIVGSSGAKSKRLDDLMSGPKFKELSRAMQATAISMRSIAYGVSGDFRAAKNAADQAIALNKNLDKEAGIWAYTFAESPLPWLALGNAYVGLRDMPGAVSAYRKALEIKPDYGPALSSLRRLGVNP